MSQVSLDPPYTVEVNGNIEHDDIPSKEHALLLAQDLVRRDESRKVEIFDRNGKQVFVSETENYKTHTISK